MRIDIGCSLIVWGNARGKLLKRSFPLDSLQEFSKKFKNEKTYMQVLGSPETLANFAEGEFAPSEARRFSKGFQVG
jgi:hypothetical protein